MIPYGTCHGLDKSISHSKFARVSTYVNHTDLFGSAVLLRLMYIAAKAKADDKLSIISSQ